MRSLVLPAAGKTLTVVISSGLRRGEDRCRLRVRVIDGSISRRRRCLGRSSYRRGFIGFPSVGKSTLMSKVTGQHSEGERRPRRRRRRSRLTHARQRRPTSSRPSVPARDASEVSTGDADDPDAADDGPGPGRLQRRQDPDARPPGHHPGGQGRQRSRSAGHRRGQDVPSHLHRAGRQQAADGQARDRGRARGFRHPGEQGAAEHRVQEEGQGRGQHHEHGPAESHRPRRQRPDRTSALCRRRR